MTDEEVIKRRLLIDGDGTGDDRRLNLLLKSFVKWCNTDNDVPSDNKAIAERLLTQLSLCEFMFEKSRISSRKAADELANYNALGKRIEAQVERSQTELKERKAELAAAQMVRKNRVEYELLADVINEQPPRTRTHHKLAIVKKQLAVLEETKQHLEKKLEMRRKHFQVLVGSLLQLQTLLQNEDDEKDAVHSFSDDDQEDTKMELSQ